MRKTALTDVSVRALKRPARGQLTIWDAKSPVGVRAMSALHPKADIRHRSRRVRSVPIADVSTI